MSSPDSSFLYLDTHFSPYLFVPPCMTLAWNDFGARTPLLLSDFAQAYFICDDYFMFSKRDQWCGIVQRAASGNILQTPSVIEYDLTDFYDNDSEL